MTLAVYTKTKIDSTYLITYIRIYFILSLEVKICLGSFIIRNLINNVLNTAESAILRPPSSVELAATVALLDQKYSSCSPELLQQLWTLASLEPIALVQFAPSSVDILQNGRTPADLRLMKHKQTSSKPDHPGQPRCGDSNPDKPSSSSTS
ncbi:hypothetical protein H1R20_g12849, partial [Candolleomyces eurysporus]